VDGVTDPDAAAEGRRRAEELLDALDRNEAAADALLAGLSEVRDLVFVGAGLTVIARDEGRRLPTAQRAQASTRQVQLGRLRDSNRGDVDGLRTWLRRAGEEVLFIRSLHEAARRTAG
jgi:hypothetical protein